MTSKTSFPSNLPSLVLMLTLTGCGGTSVLLIPDPSGKVGEVVMETAAGSQIITRTNQSVKAVQADAKPEQPLIMTPREVNNKYSNIFVKEPRYPQRYNDIQFDTGSDEIAPKYRDYLEKIIATIKKRKSCDLSVIGHSDTVGTNEVNRDLSLRRANSVFDLLTVSGISEKCIDKRFYGESDVLEDIGDEKPSIKNRRVEVEIR